MDYNISYLIGHRPILTAGTYLNSIQVENIFN